MIKELNNVEYLEAMETYGIDHFMGGCSGKDESATIYLYDGKSVLVSNDEVEEITRIKNIQLEESKNYIANIPDYD